MKELRKPSLGKPHINDDCWHYPLTDANNKILINYNGKNSNVTAEDPGRHNFNRVVNMSRNQT